MPKQELRAVITADSANFRRGMTKVQNIAKTSFAALGAAAAAGGAIAGALYARGFQVAASNEKLLTRLTTLFEGDTSQAARKFDELNKFAAVTPFRLNDIIDAYIRLKSAQFDVDQPGALTALGDLAAASDKSIGELADALISAGRGQAAMVDNFIGLAGKAEGGALTLTNALTGLEQTGVDSKDAILQFFVAAGKGSQVIGSMQRLSETAEGLKTTLLDTFDQALSDVANGNMERAKAGLQFVIDQLNELRESGEAERLGKNIADALGQFLQVDTSALSVADSVAKINAELEQMIANNTFGTLAESLMGIAKILNMIVEGIQSGAGKFIDAAMTNDLQMSRNNNPISAREVERARQDRQERLLKQTAEATTTLATRVKE